MQRFILGSSEVGMVACPIVIGVSATPQRFDALLAGATSHTTRRVAVTADQVRESGLLKERVLIHHPEATTAAELSLLQDAARRWLDMERRWADYCEAEHESRVYPILVVQVADSAGSGPTATNLGQCIASIENVCGRQMRERELAHTFNDCGDLDVNGRRIRKIDASRIEEDHDIGVVFFKQNLSTGWDCPRAEVMMSFRRAQDYTYIAQLLGRMVRTPLARRIDRDASLNDVHLLLPNFDTETVEQVVAALRDPEGAPPAADVGSSRELVTLMCREGTGDVFDALRQLTTVRLNAARAQSPLRRLLALGRALTNDELDPAASNGVKDLLVSQMSSEVSVLRATGALQAGVRGVLSVSVRTLGLDHSHGTASPAGTYTVQTASADVESLFERAGRQLSNGLHMDWWRANPDRDADEVKAELVVLCQQASALAKLERCAQEEFDRLYSIHRPSIRGLIEARRQHYDRLRLASASEVPVEWDLPPTISFRRKAAASAYQKHLYLEADGTFRADLTTWERDVLALALADTTAVAWLRNVDRQPWSFEVPYQQGADTRSLFPDLVVVRRLGSQLVADVLEPHDPTIDDNVGKAKGLARFAEHHGAGFGRIGLVRKMRIASGAERYRLLDCNEADTRRRTLEISAPEQLDRLFADRGVEIGT